MAFDWKALLDVARDLAKEAPSSTNPEARYRSALSRIYFGAYGHARNYAISYLGFVTQHAAEDHGRLKAFLRSKRRQGDGDRIDQLRKWRNLADYSDTFPSEIPPASTVMKALELAERIFLSLTLPKKV